MKNLLFLVVLGMFFGCDTKYRTEYVEVLEVQDFEGYWYCDNGSNVELTTDSLGRVTFDSTGQVLDSVNPKNGTLGTHPVISEKDLLVNGNKLVINPRNYTYNSNTHDIEEDVSGADINGQRRTDVDVELLSSDSLTIRVRVYANKVNSNVNSVVADRLFNCTL